MAQKLPRLGTLDLDGFSLDLDYYLTHPYDDIREAAQELPPLIEWVNAQLQVLTEQRLIAKQEIREAEAGAYFDLRRDGAFAELGYSGKPTDTALAHAVALNDQVKEAHRSYAVLTGWVHRLSTLQVSLQSKLELVRSTEATRRLVDGVGNDDVRDRDAAG